MFCLAKCFGVLMIPEGGNSSHLQRASPLICSSDEPAERIRVEARLFYLKTYVDVKNVSSVNNKYNNFKDDWNDPICNFSAAFQNKHTATSDQEMRL